MCCGVAPRSRVHAVCLWTVRGILNSHFPDNPSCADIRGDSRNVTPIPGPATPANSVDHFPVPIVPVRSARTKHQEHHDISLFQAKTKRSRYRVGSSPGNFDSHNSAKRNIPYRTTRTTRTNTANPMPVITVKPQETGVTDNSDTSAPEVAAATSNANKSASPFSQKWTSIVNRLRAPVLTGLHKITNLSAQHPKTVLLTVAILSLTLFVIGLFTGFSVEVDEDRLWTPGTYTSTCVAGNLDKISSVHSPTHSLTHPQQQQPDPNPFNTATGSTTSRAFPFAPAPFSWSFIKMVPKTF